MAAKLPELSAFSKTMQDLKAMVGGLVEEKRKGASGAALEQGKRCVVKMAEVRKVNRNAHEAADRLIAAAEAERCETDIVSQQVCVPGSCQGVPFPAMCECDSALEQLRCGHLPEYEMYGRRSCVVLLS